MIEVKIGKKTVKLRPETRMTNIIGEAVLRDRFSIEDLVKAVGCSSQLVRFVIHEYLRDYVEDPTREKHKTGRPTREGGLLLVSRKRGCP